MSIFNRKQTVEIDYDKLANAIVKAQDEANTENIKNAVIKAYKEIESQMPKRKYTKELLRFVIGPILIIMIVVCIIMAVFAVIYGVKSLNTFDFSNYKCYFKIVILFGIFSISVLMAIFSGFSFKEIEAEEDFNFISTMFTNLTSLGALIVAVLAMFINK